MENRQTPLVTIENDLLKDKEVQLRIKREDLNHPVVSGNKWLKLKYNLFEARRLGNNTLLTFGGAFSNHIYAVAGAGKEMGFNTIGVIRGEPHAELNPTLAFARSCGMKLHYMDRQTYRQKTNPDIIHLLRQQYGDFYLIPEGGTNQLALKGCAELVSELAEPFDYLCCPAGTGGTMAGFILGLAGEKQVLGFSVLKGDFLEKEVAGLLGRAGRHYDNWSINTEYHFGGYAKVKPTLMEFIRSFEQNHQVPLEPVYTGKMMYGLFDLVESGYFPRGSAVMAVHTGGLQGRAGFGLSTI